MSTESTKGSKTSLLIVAAAALIFIASSVMQQVPETHYAIITRFGAVNRIVEPGLRLKWPYPVESITFLEKRLQI